MNFAEAYRLMVAYPRTKSLVPEDFVAPTCYYTCEPREDVKPPVCDFTSCEEFVKTLPVLDGRVKTFAQSLVKHIATEHMTLPDKFDGFHIQHTPKGQMKAMNVVNIRRQDGGTTRTAVVELNERRFQEYLGST